MMPWSHAEEEEREARWLVDLAGAPKKCDCPRSQFFEPLVIEARMVANEVMRERREQGEKMLDHILRKKRRNGGQKAGIPATESGVD